MVKTIAVNPSYVTAMVDGLALDCLLESPSQSFTEVEGYCREDRPARRSSRTGSSQLRATLSHLSITA